MLPDDLGSRAEAFNARFPAGYILVMQKGAVTTVGVGVTGSWRATCSWDHREYRFGPELRRQRWDKMIRDIDDYEETLSVSTRVHEAPTEQADFGRLRTHGGGV